MSETVIRQPLGGHCNHRLRGATLALVVMAALLAVPPLAVAAEPAAAATADSPFATVGDTVVTRAEFEQVLQRAMRQRFYHFQPPAEQREAFRREVAQDLIDRKLLLQEADRRDIRAEAKSIEERLQAYTDRYAGRPEFEARRESLLASLRGYLEEDDRLRTLEKQVRQVADPDEDALRAYYEANPDKFTEPARQRVSVILLRVDPGAAGETWQAAMEEGKRLVWQIREGADFAELARTHSGDVSAEQGGDMGYLHRGMLAEAAEQAIDQLSIGEVSDPIRMLEGVAVFTVTERQPAQLRPYDKVTERVGALWRREQADAAWTALKQRLREATPVKIHDESLSSAVQGRLHRATGAA